MDRTCSIEGCDSAAKALGYCMPHYRRCRSDGPRVCSVCHRPAEPDGWCHAEELFWARVDMSGGPDACWPWVKRVDKDGYGTCRFAGKQSRAHRVAWRLANKQEIPPGKEILHGCDNPPCCNPRCLRPGTVTENAQDRVDRQRSAMGDDHWTRRTPDRVPRGAANGNHKLTDEQVVEIRRRITGKYGELTRLAAEYGVSYSLVAKIKAGTNR